MADVAYPRAVRDRGSLALLVGVLTIAGCSIIPQGESSTPASAGSPTASPSGPGAARDPGPTGPTEIGFVERVVDGDTAIVIIDGVDFRVRYIGIDTPESVAPNSPVEPFALEASAANERLVEGHQVVLEKDVSETDRFGRLLRYIWLQDGDRWTMVNELLVEMGYAQVATFPPDVKYVERFLAAQRRAREAGRGLWGVPAEPMDSATDSAAVRLRTWEARTRWVAGTPRRAA
jgi:micrococcal nuclease